jgi:hypothetical protein
MQECDNAGMQECDNAGMQECENAGVHECENAGRIKKRKNHYWRQRCFIPTVKHVQLINPESSIQ